MANNDAFALPHSDLNRFLFAEIGVEASGMPLSVLSILARLDVDPWQEAGRLASLPRSAAIDILARMIATTPASSWSYPDSTSIASRLVGLLPAHENSPVATPSHAPASAAPWTGEHWAVVLTVLGFVFAGLLLNVVGQTGARPRNDAPARMTANHPASHGSPHPGPPSLGQ